MQVTIAFVVFQLRFQFSFIGYLTVVVPPLLDVVASDVHSLDAECPHWSRSSRTCEWFVILAT